MSRRLTPPYRVLRFGEVIDGTTDPKFCEVTGVAKEHFGGAKHVVNELLANRLAIAVGLPVPPGELLVDDNGVIHYMSLYFGIDGETPPPIDFKEFVAQRPRLAAGTLLFDLVIGNYDRHVYNLAFQPEAGLETILFDHSEALFGAFGDVNVLLRSRGRIDLHLMPLAAHITSPSYFEFWFERFLRLDHVAFSSHTERLVAYGLLTDDESDIVERFIRHRCSKLKDWLFGDRSAFTLIDDWGLI